MIETVPLRDLVSVKGGGTPRRSVPEYYGGGIPWVTPKDMRKAVIADSEVTLTNDGVDSSPAKLIPAGAVLVVVRSGVLKHKLPVALTACAVTVNQDMKALIPNDRVAPSYLMRIIEASQPEILSWVRATTADNFPIDNLLDLEVPLPSLYEQRRIAEILDQADAIRAKRRRVLAHLDTLTQSIFHDMFGDAQTMLIRWPVDSLGNRLDFLTSGSRGWAKYYTEYGDTFLRIQNVRNDSLAFDDLAYVDPPATTEAKRTATKPGDVLLSITADLGRTAVVPDDIGTAFVNQHLAILRVSKELHPRFLSAFLTSVCGWRQMVAKNRAGVKAGLNFDDIRSLQIPVLEIESQREFATRAARVDAQKAVAQRALEADNELFASLQWRAFRGEL